MEILNIYDQQFAATIVSIELVSILYKLIDPQLALTSKLS